MSGTNWNSEMVDGEPTPFAERYQRLGEVSRGAIGQIEAAFDPILGRRVAVKLLLPFVDEDSEVARKFAEEAQITGQLDHPNIVPVYDLGEHDQQPFMVMKLVQGKTLGRLLQETPGPRNAEALQRFVGVVLRLCDALSFAHSRGVIHCDIKPENVMVGDHGQVYMMDWGVALLKTRVPGSELTPRGRTLGGPSALVWVHSASPETSGIKGTPAYMAPEQLRGRSSEIDERTDVFGLGAVLFEILTGRAPNDGGRLLAAALCDEPVTLPRENELWSQLPPELCRITCKALAPKPVERYPSIDALKADLEQFLSGGGWFEARLFRAGERIVSQGEVGDAAYIIEKGECEVRREAGSESTSLRRLGPGDVFGETAVFTRAPRTASVIAVTDVTLKIITGESLNRELDRNPWVAAFVRSLAALFREADARLSRPEQHR
jgi:eukaryotic-like serine/threonine-protein kinase